MSQKSYTLTVYDPVTRKTETVEVSEAVYHSYRRTAWNIKDNDKSFFDHEIQMSALIGGDDGAYENFREFIDTENLPEKFIGERLLCEALKEALGGLNEPDRALIHALFFDGMTEQEYARKTGVSQQTIHKKKKRILASLKKVLI